MDIENKVKEEKTRRDNEEKMKEKVLLGMSGGVDSSAAAAILIEQGYEVIGATMKMLPCQNETAIQDAKKVCEVLGIKHYTFDAVAEFQQYVMDNFVSTYAKAQTPNPCITCNQYLKFGFFYEKAKQLGCKYIATGHYAKIEDSKQYGKKVLAKSKADKKDQTYFLYRIPKEILDSILFPLEAYTDKEQIRTIAEKYRLPVASKKDSQEICFIPDDDYAQYLITCGKLKPKQGNIVTKEGKILGKHKGLFYYTIGQRKGMGIAHETPLYVVALDPIKNEVIVGSQQDLYGKELIAEDVNYLLMDSLTQKMDVLAKVRYRSQEAKATLYPETDHRVKVVFEEPQRAITKGQSVVFYTPDGIVIGGGTIQ